MRIKYEKPLVAVERYELSQAIAGCVIKIGPQRYPDLRPHRCGHPSDHSGVRK